MESCVRSFWEFERMGGELVGGGGWIEGSGVRGCEVSGKGVAGAYGGGWCLDAA